MSIAAGAPEDILEYGPVFQILNSISAGLSILGSSSVICAFMAFPRLRRYFSRLVLYLAISDLWLCTAMIMGQSPAPHYTKCMVQSTLSTYFGLASLLWTASIADSLRRVILSADLRLESKPEANLHIFNWGLPASAIVLGFVTRVFGPAGTMCWIRNTASGTIIRMVTFYVPLWLVIGYSLWVYWCVTTVMKRAIDQNTEQFFDGVLNLDVSPQHYERELLRQRGSLQILLMLPVVLIICWTPSTIRRIIDLFLPDFGQSTLDYLCVATGPLQGALNAAVYGLTPAVRDALTGRLDHSARILKGVQYRLRVIGSTHRTRRKDSRGSKRRGLDSNNLKFSNLEDDEDPILGARTSSTAEGAPSGDVVLTVAPVPTTLGLSEHPDLGTSAASAAQPDSPMSQVSPGSPTFYSDGWEAQKGADQM